MRRIFTCFAFLSFFGCGQKNSTQTNALDNTHPDKVEKYVSMACPTGDISLTLNPNNNFDLTILFWDDKTHRHTGQETVKGSWTKTNGGLTLTTNDRNTIKYELTTTSMKVGATEINSKTYAFKSGDNKFFATGFDLLDQRETDTFLINQTK